MPDNPRRLARRAAMFREAVAEADDATLLAWMQEGWGQEMQAEWCRHLSQALLEEAAEMFASPEPEPTVTPDPGLPPGTTVTTAEDGRLVLRVDGNTKVDPVARWEEFDPVEPERRVRWRVTADGYEPVEPGQLLGWPSSFTGTLTVTSGSESWGTIDERKEAVFRLAMELAEHHEPALPDYLAGLGIGPATVAEIVRQAPHAGVMGHEFVGPGHLDPECAACGLERSEVENSPAPVPCLGRPVR